MVGIGRRTGKIRRRMKSGFLIQAIIPNFGLWRLHDRPAYHTDT